MPTIYFPLVH